MNDEKITKEKIRKAIERECQNMSGEELKSCSLTTIKKLTKTPFLRRTE